jgi:hypothetical protein
MRPRLRAESRKSLTLVLPLLNYRQFDTIFVLAMRKPFDVPAERLLSEKKSGRQDGD